MKKIPVWTFWQNFNDTKLPPYIECCIDSMYKHFSEDRFEVNVLNYENIDTFIPELRKDIFNINYTFTKPPNGISLDKLKTRKFGIIADYIRLVLLQKYGGIWTDADNIMLRNPQELLDFLEYKDFIASTRFWKSNKYIISNGFLVSQPNGKIISKWLNLVNKKLDKMKEKENYNIQSYGMFGENMVGNLIKQNIDSCFIYFDDTILPIKCKQRKIFFEEKYNYKNLIEDKAPLCCTIWNAGIPDSIKEYTKEELLSGNIFLSEVFRKALND